MRGCKFEYEKGQDGDMEKILIESRLYHYEVEFIDSIAAIMQGFHDRYTFVIDKNVYALYEKEFQNLSKDNIFLIDAIEEKKNMDTVMELIEFWRRRGIRKDWKVICFGGGITQDITTISSNLYLRNIEWYFFPTTLLAMCDSCIGGKCGINLGEYKNQIGVFYPPKKIFIYERFLDTLEQEDYINGWGELLKFSLTRDNKFYEKIEEVDCYIPCSTISDMIYQGLNVKKEVIEIDEFEGDYRRVLNYGHTFGHALEAYTHNKIPHGKAVIWGIDVVNYIAFKRGVLDEDSYLRIKRLIKEAFIQEEIVVENGGELFDIIKTDKKVRQNKIHLALLTNISKLIIYPIEINDVLKKDFLDYLEETHGYYCS